MSDLLVRNRNSRVRLAQKLVASDHLKTQQQFVAECDINRIVANARRGIAPRYVNPNTARYGDFSSLPDFATAHDVIMKAREAFQALPAGLRAELDNDPARLASITKSQAERYGLLKEKPPAPPATPPASQPPGSDSDPSGDSASASKGAKKGSKEPKAD